MCQKTLKRMQAALNGFAYAPCFNGKTAVAAMNPITAKYVPSIVGAKDKYAFKMYEKPLSAAHACLGEFTNLPYLSADKLFAALYRAACNMLDGSIQNDLDGVIKNADRFCSYAKMTTCLCNVLTGFDEYSPLPKIVARHILDDCSSPVFTASVAYRVIKDAIDHDCQFYHAGDNEKRAQHIDLLRWCFDGVKDVPVSNIRKAENTKNELIYGNQDTAVMAYNYYYHRTKDDIGMEIRCVMNKNENIAMSIGANSYIEFAGKIDRGHYRPADKYVAFIRGNVQMCDNAGWCRSFNTISSAPYQPDPMDVAKLLVADGKTLKDFNPLLMQ